MNFSAAMQYLRSGQCAKVPSMRGRIERYDWPSTTAGTTANTVEKAVADLYGAQSDPATSVYTLAFVENPSFESVAGTPQGKDSQGRYVFVVHQHAGAGTVWEYLGGLSTSEEDPIPPEASGSAVSYDPAKPLELDPELLRLMATSTAWEVVSTADVAAAQTSTKRW